MTIMLHVPAVNIGVTPTSRVQRATGTYVDLAISGVYRGVAPPGSNQTAEPRPVP